VSDQPTEGNRPLNRLFKMAVMAGVEDSVRLHIQRGDDINACDDKGLTAESQLHLVINDLGAETDERIEYTAHSESFAVHADPDETPDEEAIAITMLLKPQGIDG